MDNAPGTPPQSRKRRFFDDPTSHAKKTVHSPAPEEQPNVIAPVPAPEYDDEDHVVSIPPEKNSPEIIEEEEKDGFDASLFTSIIGEELSALVLHNLKQISGGNMERGTLPIYPHCPPTLFHYGNIYPIEFF